MLKVQTNSYDVEHITTFMATMTNTMFWWVIDLWWEKIPPTHPWFILMKNNMEKTYENRKIKLWKNTTLSLLKPNVHSKLTNLHFIHLTNDYFFVIIIIIKDGRWIHHEIPLIYTWKANIITMWIDFSWVWMNGTK